MQLSQTQVQVERQGEIQESEFGIGDPWLIIEYLTKNVYSDIIRVIIQEISSNSRDAHREIGQTRRMRITLPNRFDSTIKFRDFGPGMDPERMHTIFKRYGKSTKRGDNKQTGGFGIGGKTPWAYADVFTMRSIAMENGKMVCREYSAIKAEDRTLKLVEMGSPLEIDVNDPEIPEDDKHTGLTVSMDVKQDDWQTFATKVIDITKFWKEEERPEICGQDPAPTFPDMSIMYEGDGWKLLNVNQAVSVKNGYSSNTATVVVDGIPYPLVGNSLGIGYGGNMDHLRPLLDGRFVYYFGVGELELALSRESLQYNERTKPALIAKLEEAYKSLQTQINDAMKDCKTLREAITKYNEMQRSFKITEFVKKAEWNGYNVAKDRFPGNYVATIREYKKESGAKGDKIRSKEIDHFDINAGVLLCFLDTEQRSILRVHTLFAKYPDMDSIQVIERKNRSADADVQWEDWKKCVHFADFAPINMSTVEKMKRQRGTYHSNVVKAYSFVKQSDKPREMWDAEDVDMEDGEGVYVTLDRGVSVDFDHGSIASTIRLLGSINVVGIPARFAKDMGDGWKTLKSYLAERIAELEGKIDFQEIANRVHLEQFNAQKVFSERGFKEFSKGEFLAMIDDQSCPLVRWIKRSVDIVNTPCSSTRDYNTYTLLLSKANKQPQLPPVTDDIKALFDECRASYPLFFCVGFSDELKSDIALYINSKNQALTPAQVAV